VTGDDLRAAAAAATELLGQVPDPSARVPTVDTDVTGVAGHVTASLLWYAQDLAVGPEETSAFSLASRPEVGLAEVVRQMRGAAEVLARTVDAAGPDDRGWHDWGISDASGFAGMGCAELLIHAGDVAAAIGLDWTPPAYLAAALRDRLFPWAPRLAQPWASVLWATGRGELPGLARVTSWRWHSAPLDEWDGTQPG
jgi:hypothetical protein